MTMFDDSYFLMWKEHMLDALTQMGLLKMLCGKTTMPEYMSDAEWEDLDELAFSTIRSCKIH